MRRSGRSATVMITVFTMITVIILGSAPAGAAPDAVQGVFTAAGQRQWVSCAGNGAPTVVLVSGLGSSHTVWATVLGPLREMARVCTYDRPGLGASPHRLGSPWTDAGMQATELKDLLSAAGEKGPFILVGHSYAGLIVRALAARYPDDVAGMLLLDGVYPGIQRTFLPSYHGPWHEGGTVIDMNASERATAGGPNLGATPLVVLSAGHPQNGTAWADAKWNAEQAKAALLSTNSVHWIAKKSGHVIQRDQPAILVKAVRHLLDDVAAVRAAAVLPG